MAKPVCDDVASGIAEVYCTLGLLSICASPLDASQSGCTLTSAPAATPSSLDLSELDINPLADVVATSEVAASMFVLALLFSVLLRPWLAVSVLTLLPSAVETVVEKAASSPSASASSLSVLSAAGAELTIPLTSEST